MTESPQDLSLDFAAGDHRAGFRLQRFEVYNWGTFHEHVWTLSPGGDNSLLTGDIGSGKSTLVDAVTTLLVPVQRITYNKAAGAESRERTLRSYVLGHYKSERGESGFSAKAVALRDHNSYSVILGLFYNEGFDRHVTLAQVFWMRDTQGQPARLYVVADRPLTIAGDFDDFGNDIKDLRKRLRGQRELELHDSFPPYGTALRRRFGIDNEQALELFNQTVSMKSVGNLTDFVRGHMLEAFPVQARIEALIGHFDDLDRAHAAVLKAKAQIAALEPLAADCEHHGELNEGVEDLRACRDMLQSWFAQLKGDLLEQRLQRLDGELAQLESRLLRLAEQRREHQSRRDDIKQAISESGGDRLERLKGESERLRQQQSERRQRTRDYEELAGWLELPEASDEAGFRANLGRIDEALENMDDRESELQNRLTEQSVAFRARRERHDELDGELASLRQRRSNLPAAMLALR